MTTASSARMFVYVANAEDGDIGVYAMAPATGALEPLERVPAGKGTMPLAFSPDGRRLYAAIRTAPYSVASYAIDRRTGRLTHLATAPLPESMAYLSVDRTGRFLLGASYGGSLVSVSPIGAEGVAQGEPVQILPTGRNAHAVLPDPSNRFVYATNLGSDQIVQWVFDERTGELTPNRPGIATAAPGAGPRHFVFSPNGRFAYVLGELSGTVTCYHLDRRSGLLTEGEAFASVPPAAGLHPGRPRSPTIPGMPTPAPADLAKAIWAADIHMTPDGRFLYASERTTSTIAAFAADPVSGKLAFLKSTPTEAQPRGFRIDPHGRFMIATGEKSDQLSVYRINRESGDLEQVGRYPAGAGANWVVILEAAG